MKQSKLSKEFDVPGYPEYKLWFDGEDRHSDIRWNDVTGVLRLVTSPGNSPCAKATIQEFTSNCGIKAISHLSVVCSMPMPEWKELVEQWCRSVCNTVLIVASGNHRLMRNVYSDYETSPEVHNINYGRPSGDSFNICIGWKSLPDEKIKFWEAAFPGVE